MRKASPPHEFPKKPPLVTIRSAATNKITSFKSLHKISLETTQKKNHKNQTSGTPPEKKVLSIQHLTSCRLLNLKTLILLLFTEQWLYTLENREIGKNMD